jgi:hypothetical protein
MLKTSQASCGRHLTVNISATTFHLTRHAGLRSQTTVVFEIFWSCVAKCEADWLRSSKKVAK